MLDFHRAAMIEANQDEAAFEAEVLYANYTPTGSTLETMDCPALPFFVYRYHVKDGQVIRQIVARSCDFDNACQAVEEDREEFARGNPYYTHRIVKDNRVLKCWL
jgi:hypothetical protein